MNSEAAYPEYEVLDDSNPKAVINLLPASVSTYIKAIPSDIWDLSEDELEESNRVNAIDSMLRHAFWLEYDRAIKTGSSMNLTNVYAGIANRATFLKEVVANSYRLAYICTPPTDYVTRLEELLTIGLKQYREILKLPNINSKGGVDSRLVAVKQKIIEDVANRRRGQVIQRVEVQSKNLNVNVEANSKNAPRSVEEIEKEIAALEMKKAQPILIPEKLGGVSYESEKQTELEVVEVTAEPVD